MKQRNYNIHRWHFRNTRIFPNPVTSKLIEIVNVILELEKCKLHFEVNFHRTETELFHFNFCHGKNSFFYGCRLNYIFVDCIALMYIKTHADYYDVVKETSTCCHSFNRLFFRKSGKRIAIFPIYSQESHANVPPPPHSKLEKRGKIAHPKRCSSPNTSKVSALWLLTYPPRRRCYSARRASAAHVRRGPVSGLVRDVIRAHWPRERALFRVFRSDGPIRCSAGGGPAINALLGEIQSWPAIYAIRETRARANSDDVYSARRAIGNLIYLSGS